MYSDDVQAAHVADEMRSEQRRLIALLEQIDPDATPLTKQLRARGYMSFADSIRLARYEEAQQRESEARG